MRAPRSSFLRTELLLLLFAYPLLAAGCGPRMVWGIPEDQLRADLAKGQYASLASIDFSRNDPADCLSLAPCAPYCLSLVFDSLGKQAEAQRMLELAWSRSPSPWKEEAGVRLAESLISQKRYDAAIDAARQLARSGDADARQRGQRLLVEALYWNKSDEDALREADRLVDPDAEVLLFRAVSSLRLGRADAHDLVMRLFRSEGVSALHGRAYSFIAADQSALGLFTATERDLLSAKYDFVQGSWTKGIPLMEGVLAASDPAQIADGVLVDDLGNAFLYAGKYAEGAKFMQGMAQRLSGQARVDALEQAGKLARRARDYAKALDSLRLAAKESPTAEQRDRARWFVLDILFTLAPDDLSTQVASEAASWEDPGYFTDLMQSRIAELVQARKWKTLMSLWRALETSGPGEVRAQLSYLIARAWQEGLVIRLPGTPPVTADALFLDAERRNPSGYYGILAACMLGDVPDRALLAPEQPDPETTLDPIAAGLLSFGLTDQAYARVWPSRDALSEEQLRAASRAFTAAWDYRSSMYLVGAVARRRRLSPSEMKSYYPLAYEDLIDPLVAKEGIPSHVLYGMVREESYFDAGAVSSAGAVGLSQLMPDTAAPIARSLKIQSPDLRDPGTNLAIGARHLSDLLARTGSTTKALLAYNAGLTRLRQWDKAGRDLAPDLLVESVPIAESREYVRKILVSAVMYASLYNDVDPRDAALSFFNISPQAGPAPGSSSRGPTGATPR